jgi:Holliday junction resolvase RusA-like endonuclease
VSLTYRAEIPIPPSVDSMYRNVPKVGRVKTGKYNQWSKDCAMLLAAVRKVRLDPPLQIRLTIYGGKGFDERSDISNRHKAPEDALKEAGIIPDDSVKYVHLTSQRYVPPTDPKLPARAIIEVRELREDGVV